MNEVEILPARSAIDWETIEKDWRAGIKTKLQMSEEYGVSRAAIDKHFDKLGITRDLSAKIARETQVLVTQQAVTKEVTKTRLHVTENEIVTANAQLQAGIIRSQRKDIQKYAALAQRMLEELEGVTDLRADFAQLGELLYAPNEKGVDKLNEIYHKVMALPGRVDSLKKLSEVLKVLIGLERQAFGLADNSNGEADKPPVDPRALDNDVARRIAFILIQAERRG